MPKLRTKGDLRADAMLEAAYALFVERGFAATAIEDVIALSGGSKSLLYKRFGNKEGLFSALIAKVTAEIEDGMRDARIPEGAPMREALATFARAAAGAILRKELIDLLRLAIGEASRFPTLGAQFWRSGPEPVGALFVAYLRRRGVEGDDIEPLADLFFAMLVDRPALAMALGARGLMEPDERDAHAARVVDAYCAIIASRLAR
ncbi:MAG: TetR/AcrR family transcriptional regulator [Salinarimonadaceae bacterium]|nr:MAG: TetR/AcrR family transcriptional regulator [Salinarimonadaceae bacterium]